MKSVRIRSYTELRRISPYSVQMRKNVGKMRTRITPNTDTFYAVSRSRILAKRSKKHGNIII